MPSKPTHVCICQHCGKEFKIAPNRIRYGEGKYCSPPCGWSAQNIPVSKRFWSKVQKTDTCWLWTGGRNRQGYGRIRSNGTNRPAHQVAWEMENNSPIPEGHEICHHCDNPSCVRPSHLFSGTRKDNVQDMIQKNRRSTLAHGSGERHGMAKLTEQQVIQIRRRRSNGESPKALANEFGINRSHIHRILNGSLWKEIIKP